jgi:transcriptional regulator of heat shock response
VLKAIKKVMGMPRKTDQQERKDLVLGYVVEQYIKNLNPIGSAFLAKEYHLDWSSATIRNILAELEEEGYLTHPHTSAGRIPTHRGYRYYVDHLMHQIQLLEGEKNRIQKEYRDSISKLEKLVEKTSRIVSEVTHYTSIISVDGWEGQIIYRGTNYVVGYPEMQDIKTIQNMLKVLEEKERIFEVISRDLQSKIDIYIGQEIACKEIEGCSLAVCEYHQKDGSSGRIAVLGPTSMDYERVVSTLTYVTEIISDGP